MRIYNRETTAMWGEYRINGLHIVSVIDDDDFGLKSEVHFVISNEDIPRLFSMITEQEFVDLCRKDGLSGMLDFFNRNGIPWQREDAY